MKATHIRNRKLAALCCIKRIDPYAERVAASQQQERDGSRESDEASAYIRGVEDGEQSSKIDDLWDGGIEDYSERESAEPGVHGNCSILQW